MRPESERGILVSRKATDAEGGEVVNLTDSAGPGCPMHTFF